MYLLTGMGYDVPIDLPALLSVARWLEGELGHPLPGMVKEAGLRWHPGAA